MHHSYCNKFVISKVQVLAIKCITLGISINIDIKKLNP